MVFVENVDNLIYILHDSTYDLYNTSKYSDSDNLSNLNLQNNFRINSKIFNLIVPKDFVVLKSTINYDFTRLIVLYENSKIPTNKILIVYKIEASNIYYLKIIPSFEISIYKKYSLRDFVYSYNILENYEAIYFVKLFFFLIF